MKYNYSNFIASRTQIVNNKSFAAKTLTSVTNTDVGGNQEAEYVRPYYFYLAGALCSLRTGHMTRFQIKILKRLGFTG
jgi:hypothetical protein